MISRIGYLRSFDRRIWVLFSGRIIGVTGFSIVVPFLSIYLNQQLGVPMTVVGMIFLFSSGAGAVGQILGGELADRVGRKKVMIFSMASRSVVFALISVVMMNHGDYPVIGLLIVGSNFFGSFFEPASSAMVADLVEPSKRLEAYGLLRIGANIGWTLGPLLGGLLAIISYSSLFLLTAFCTASVAFIVILLVSDSRSSIKTERFNARDLLAVRKDTVFAAFCLISVLLSLVTAQMSSVYSVFSEKVVGVQVYEVGYLYAINGIMVVFLQFPVARWVSRFRMTNAISMGAFLYAIGYFLVAFTNDFFTLAFCMVVISMGEIVVSPALSNLVANMSPENMRGRYMGVYGLFSQFGWSMGPLAGGVLMDAFVGTPIILWGGIASFAIAASIGYLALRSRMKESIDRVQSAQRS
jgi:MFS family permease